jgi:hypothetical protein
MRFVTLVNRTNETLEGTWDGRHYTLGPGKHSFPELAAIKFKEQNPVMGTLDPRDGSMTYKIGIEELNDPTSPISISSTGSIERWDRSKLAGAPPVEIVPGDNGLYQTGRTAGSTPLPAGASFVDPTN